MFRPPDALPALGDRIRAPVCHHQRGWCGCTGTVSDQRSRRPQVAGGAADGLVVTAAQTPRSPGSRTTLANVIAREHRLLGMVASGDHTARRELDLTALLRAVHADALATQLGLPTNLSLRALASAVEEPWRTIFRDHRSAMRTTTALAAVDLPPAVADFLA